MESEHAEHTLPADAGEWLTISDLAVRKGLSKATISERVKKFEADGLLETRPAEKGKGKLVQVAAYDAAVEASGDPAREQAADTKAETADADAEPRGDNRFRNAAAVEKENAAILAQIRVGRALGQVIATDQIKPAVEDCAEILLRILDRPLARAAALDAAARTGGVNGIRVVLREIVREQKAAAAEAFASLAETPLDQPAPLPPETPEAAEPELPLEQDAAPPEQAEPAPCNSNSDTPPEA